jgi:uncharacterized protein YjbI with pentapeptide repeats
VLTQFNEVADFDDAQFKVLVSFFKARFKEVDFYGAQFKAATFYEAQFEKKS